MTDWLEHSVQVEVPTPIDHVWALWSDLEKMPIWMKWIDQVSISPQDPDLSIWTLRSTGLEFSWQSRILKLIPNQIIQWESVDGLPNRGAIRFYDRKSSCVVKLTIAYGVPGLLAALMDNVFVGRVVESTLAADMERFRTYAAEQYDGSPERAD